MVDQDSQKYAKKILTIPNILSFFRLCLIPIIVWSYCVSKNYILTIIVFGISGLTDIVDGYIARHFNMISNFGKVFDPLADKLTQIAIISCLITRFWYMVIPLAIFVVKEVGMGVVALVTAKKTRTIKGADWHGKLNTVVFFILMVIHLAWYDIPTPVSIIIVTVSVSMMLISATLYTIRNAKALKAQKAVKE